MIDLDDFGALLEARGYDFFSGVPCSLLKGLINHAINSWEYYAAANEADAVAIAAGAWLGGRKAAVLFQNSGLTNAISPLTSLNYVFRIPVLGFVSLRGEPCTADEPQHELVGRITADLLRLCRIESLVLSGDREEAAAQLARADEWISREQSVFFLVRKGVFADEPLRRRLAMPSPSRKLHISPRPPAYPSRREALAVLDALSGPNTTPLARCGRGAGGEGTSVLSGPRSGQNTVLLATTGKTGRELFQLRDCASHLYMVGSMGCASSLGLGLALARPEKKVIVIDGDGALLMRMGALATNGFYRPANLLHVVLDNRSHDSTGGQDTVSGNVCFAAVASHSGYPAAVEAHDLDEFAAAIRQWLDAPRLTLLAMPIAKGSTPGLGRPNINPYEVKKRLMRYVSAPKY